MEARYDRSHEAFAKLPSRAYMVVRSTRSLHEMGGAGTAPTDDRKEHRQGDNKEGHLHHGRPDVMLSDNGTQFTSAAFTQRLTEFGIKHHTTPVYTPQCNSVERTNLTIKIMIGQYVGTITKIGTSTCPHYSCNDPP